MPADAAFEDSSWSVLEHEYSVLVDLHIKLLTEKRRPGTFFAVYNGKKTGIFFGWGAAGPLVVGHSGATFKKFATYAGAYASLPPALQRTTPASDPDAESRSAREAKEVAATAVGHARALQQAQHAARQHPEYGARPSAPASAGGHPPPAPSAQPRAPSGWWGLPSG